MELIILTNHNRDWEKQFLSEQKLLAVKLKEITSKIHHVGSTAIAGFLAKPIIDIAIESSEFPPAIATIEKLKSIGYACKGESGVNGRYFFTKGFPRKFNLHFCLVGSKIVEEQLKFIAVLAKNDKLRKEYEQIKLLNSKDKDIDSKEYALSKTAFIQKVIKNVKS